MVLDSVMRISYIDGNRLVMRFEMLNTEDVDDQLVRMSIQLSPAQHRDLVSMAKRRQISAAALMREVVRGFLAGDPARQREEVAA